MANFDEDILRKKEEKEKLIEQMDQTKNEYMKLVEEFSKSWFEEKTKQIVTRNPEHAIDLGEEKLKELKDKIRDLIEDTQNLVNEYLNQDYIWWHTNEDLTFYYSDDHRILDKHDKQIKLLFGELGKVLSEYEFVSTKGFDNGLLENWNRDGKIQYPYRLDYPDFIYQINKNYVEEIKKAQELNREIDKLEKEKEKENIGEIWDSL